MLAPERINAPNRIDSTHGMIVVKVEDHSHVSEQIEAGCKAIWAILPTIVRCEVVFILILD